MSISWNYYNAVDVLRPGNAMEAFMVRDWVEAAGFMLVIAACYMMVVPV
jgi:hypothetical protein